MAPYRITLFDTEGDAQEEHVIEFPQDDDAIDHAGSINHPHAIVVRQGERQVASFPPTNPPQRPPRA
jgi:hypothetical protein